MSIKDFEKWAEAAIEDAKPLCSRCKKVKINRGISFGEKMFCMDCAKNDKERAMVLIGRKVSKAVAEEMERTMSNLLLHGDSEGPP